MKYISEFEDFNSVFNTNTPKIMEEYLSKNILIKGKNSIKLTTFIPIRNSKYSVEIFRMHNKIYLEQKRYKLLSTRSSSSDTNVIGNYVHKYLNTVFEEIKKGNFIYG
jgi:hypothetical protein